jgi:hypothetical protein
MMRYHVLVAHKGMDTDGCEDVKMDDDPNSFGNLRDFRIVAENAVLTELATESLILNRSFLL